MAKKHVYSGQYTRHRRRTPITLGPPQYHDSKSFSRLANMASQYLWACYNMMNGNYLVLATVFAVVLLSFLIPDISQKIHATTELNSMKKVLDVMTEEVNRAEAACLTAADEIRFLQSYTQDDTTETVSIRPEISKTYQSAPASEPFPSQLKSKGISEYSNEYYTPKQTYPTRKSQSCPTYTPIHSTLKKTKTN